MAIEPTRALLEHASDSILVGRASDGDTESFGVLVHRYAPLLRAYARRLLPGSADIDDVVQDTFITAWEALPTLEHPERVKAWLMRITGRNALTRIRQLRSTVDVTEIDIADPAADQPEQLVETHAGIAALALALKELPDAQRACWVEREIGGSTYAEIAAALDIPVSTARGLLARARAQLLIRMDGWD